jgi:hypothetical protein
MVLTTKHTKKSQRTQRLVLVNHPDSYVTLHNSGNKFSFPFYEYPLPNLPPWGKVGKGVLNKNVSYMSLVICELQKVVITNDSTDRLRKEEPSTT